MPRLGCLLILLLLSASVANAAFGPARQSESLRTALRAARADTMLSVIVYHEVQADIASLDANLRRLHTSRATRHRAVIEALQTTAVETQTALRDTLIRLQAAGLVAGFRPFWIVNCVVAAGVPEAIDAIGRVPGVDYVDLNFGIEIIKGERTTRRTLDENHGVPRGVRAIRAADVWYQLGYDGTGRLVANLDTGVDGLHPALGSRWRGQQAPAAHCWRDAASSGSFPIDQNGHGTHVMGTICGNSTVSNDSIGVAPGARWIAYRAVDQVSAPVFNNAVMDAFQWFADPDGDPLTLDDVPDVVQNSWGVHGGMPGYEDCFTLWNNAIINCEAAGVVVLFSAGNEGRSGAYTLRSPATVAIDSVTMFAVGAVDATNDTIPPYEIADFSSRGPSDCPPRTAVKPEVCAPGVAVYSSVPNGQYAQYNGTSMAGPHVAGLVALLRQARPDADVREIKSALLRSAIDYGPAGDDNTYGFGFVDAFAAVQMLLADRGFVAGRVSDAQTAEPLAGVRVEVLQTGRTAFTNANGDYLLAVLADSPWTLRFSAFRYTPHVAAVSVSEGDTLWLNAALQLAPLGTLRGVVYAGGRSPVINAQISFPGIPQSPLYTDSNGHFLLTLPGDTMYAVRAAYHDAIWDTTVFVATGALLDIQARLLSPRSQPAGPDAYGYRAYDRYDSGYAADYDWFEIAPSAGGGGTAVQLQARDSSAFLKLPFPLRYYGQTYDSLTVNENGWLAAGVSHDHTFFNFTIPGPSGPAAMLAPFWDNLGWLNDAEICYLHDSLRGRFLIEYRNLRFMPPGPGRVTFQAQIYDAHVRPTASGDCEIVFLYERADDPGNCTVGLEDPTETIGLQLLYNGAYAPQSWQIGLGAAIRFSTRTDGAVGRISGRIIAIPAPADYRAAILRAGWRVVTPAADGSFAADSLLTGLNSVRLWLPGYESAALTIPVGRDSTSVVNLNIWRLDPPRQLSGERDGEYVRLRWLPPHPGGRASGLDELEHYLVYRNDSAMAAVSDTAYAEAVPYPGWLRYYVRTVYSGGRSDTSNHVLIDATSDVEGAEAGIIRFVELRPGKPNPFNAQTRIAFALPASRRVLLEVFDILGRRMDILADDTFQPGVHELLWNCAHCPSGMYLVRLQTADRTLLQKLLLLR